MVLSCNNHAASHSIYRSIMVWTKSKDLSLLRTIAAEGIFINTKAGSRERGAAWLNVFFFFPHVLLPFENKEVFTKLSVYSIYICELLLFIKLYSYL